MGQKQSVDSDNEIITETNNEIITETNNEIDIDDLVVKTDDNMVLDTNDVASVMMLETKKRALNNTIFRLNKTISDKKGKINIMDNEIEKKKLAIEQYTENLNNLKTEYFRMRDTTSEYQYNSRNKIRHCNSTSN
jgi:hypothetical protein